MFARIACLRRSCCLLEDPGIAKDSGGPAMGRGGKLMEFRLVLCPPAISGLTCVSVGCAQVLTFGGWHSNFSVMRMPYTRFSLVLCIREYLNYSKRVNKQDTDWDVTD